jgi:hypothetical protein
MMPNFTRQVLTSTAHLDQPRPTYVSKEENPSVQKRHESSYQISLELQKLFSHMILGNQKYRNPYDVLNNLCDENGTKMQIGD